MPTNELHYLSAWELSGLIRGREISPVDVVEACLSRIEETEPTLNSFITLLPEQARAAAQRAEQEIGRGNYRGPLHGIPVGLKDLFHTAGVRTTSGTRIYDTHVPSPRLHGCNEIQRGGGDPVGQIEHAPAGFRPHWGERGLRPHAQPVESGAHYRRVQRRQRFGGGGGSMHHHHGQRYGRQRSHTGGALRHCGFEAHIWSG